jgi:putative transposase
VSVVAVCRRVGMTTANYYARRKARRRRQVEEDLVVELVRAERQLQPRLGARKLRVLIQGPLKATGVQVGRDRLFEILRAAGLLVAPLPASSPCTTDSYHYLPVFTNQVKDRVLSRPNEVWVSDLTCMCARRRALCIWRW